MFKGIAFALLLICIGISSAHSDEPLNPDLCGPHWVVLLASLESDREFSRPVYKTPIRAVMEPRPQKVRLNNGARRKVGAASAQQRSAYISKGQAVRSPEADPEVQNRIDEALMAFEHLLAISKGANAMNSHLQVREASWRDAQKAWEKSSTALPASIRRLRRCAVPLKTARGMIERVNQLFLQARDSSDPMKAAVLLERHNQLMKQAEVPLQRAERCYNATRNAYLKGRKADDRSQVRVSGQP